MGGRTQGADRFKVSINVRFSWPRQPQQFWPVPVNRCWVSPCPWESASGTPRPVPRKGPAFVLRAPDALRRLWPETSKCPSLVYSCAYWQGEKSSGSGGTLEQAQEAKLDLVCCKRALREGQRLLDVGCGWGLPTMQSAPDGRLNRLVLTPEGRNAFARFVDHSEVPVEIGRFLRENP